MVELNCTFSIVTEMNFYFQWPSFVIQSFCSKLTPIHDEKFARVQLDESSPFACQLETVAPQYSHSINRSLVFGCNSKHFAILHLKLEC